MFTVRESFAVPTGDGGMISYTKGAIVDGDDPVATTHAHLLIPVAAPNRTGIVAPPVETATAGPGEKRTAPAKGKPDA